MKTTLLQVNTLKLLGDLQTPIGLYLKIRDLYKHSVLLESSDYHTAVNSNSYIAFSPMASYKVENESICMSFPDGTKQDIRIQDKHTVADSLNDFIASFQLQGQEAGLVNGLFGYTAYGAVRYFEDLNLSAAANPLNAERPENAGAPGNAANTKNVGTPENNLPEMQYVLFKYVIGMNHYRNEISVTENLLEGESSRIQDILHILESPNIALYDFQTTGREVSDITDEDYRAMVSRGKAHCYRGDVFQIVLSRRFKQAFKGDDILLYRRLRSINPSPYLFYFDFGSFRVFGSSPEAHLVIREEEVYITPIAGTAPISGNAQQDREAGEALLKDPKENAEHVMLVDLARNDLSRNAGKVSVELFRELQNYSHVMHLVSLVRAELAPNTNRIRLFADTFPAGTLSGAPKIRAMQLIDQIEAHDRELYGGCIGYIGFDGSMNQAITIRSFISRDNVLYYQAGAGIVAKSDEEKELQEVNSKLGALKKAIDLASKQTEL